MNAWCKLLGVPFGRVSWKRELGRGKSGDLCLDCCPKISVRKRMGGLVIHPSLLIWVYQVCPATPEYERVKPFSRSLVQEPTLCVEVSPTIFNSIQFSFIYIATNYNNCHLKALK